MADFREIARKWQKKWEEKGIFKAKEDPKKKKFFVLGTEESCNPVGHQIYLANSYQE